MKPDFTVTSLVVSPAVPVRGGTFTATVTVRNQGNLSADAGVVRIWTSKPGTAKAGDAGDAQQAAGMLAAGESRTFAFALSVPTRPGTHHARAFVDADDGADENNEGNNQKKTSYKPQDAGTQPLPAAVELRNLEQTYDGAEKTVAVATDPAGLAVEITYDGELQAPVGAGTYQVVATMVDEKHAGSAADALAVEKASATVALGDLQHVFDGMPRNASVATDPVGLAVEITYGGVFDAPVDAGSYAVLATAVDPNYEGVAMDTLVVAKAPAVVELANLLQVYDGEPKPVVVSTDPDGMNVDVTYGASMDGNERMLSRGSSQPPVAAGSYRVEAVAADENHEGSSVGTLEILPAFQTIDFPEVGDRLITDVVDLTATASSGLPVSFAVASGPARIAGTTLAFTGTGEVAIIASQEGDDNWTAAPDEIQALTAKNGPTVLVVSASGVNVRENGEGRFFVRLNQDPGAIVRMAVTRSAGDAGLTIQTEMALTFRSSNWSKWQAVTLAGTDDANPDNEEATFQISTLGMEDQYVSATALDDDIGENVALASSGSMIFGTKATHPEYLIDGIQTVSTNFGYTCWTNLSSPGTITLDLKAETAVSRIRLLNWDWDARVHRYKIEWSLNGTDWSPTPLVDASTGAHSGWEDWEVNQMARPAVHGPLQLGHSERVPRRIGSVRPALGR